MEISRSLGNKIKSKTEKVLGRKVRLYDFSGASLSDPSLGVDFKAVEAIQKKENISEKKNDFWCFWTPLHYEGKVVGALSLRGKNKKKTSEVAFLAKGLVETFLYEEFLIKNIHIANDLRSEFVKDILIGNNIKTTEDAVDQGDIVGVNLRTKQAVFLIKIDNLFENYKEKRKEFSEEETRTSFQEYLKDLESFISKTFEDKLQNCAVYIGKDRFVLLKDIKRENANTVNSFKILKNQGKDLHKELNNKFPNKTSISIGQYYPGLAGLKKSFEDANISMKIGEKVIGKNDVYHILDVAMYVGLLGSVTNIRKNELSFQVLKDLFEDKDLLKTTQTFLDCGMNLTKAAKKLHLHRNTLIYRLDKVKKMIGLNPRRFHDAIQIRLGLMAHSRQDQKITVN